MVLRIVASVIILAANVQLRPGFCQSTPTLEFSGRSVTASDLSNNLTGHLSGNLTKPEFMTDILSVYTKDAFDKGIRQPMAGHYDQKGTTLVFTPILPFAAGQSYLARLAVDLHGDAIHELTFTTPSSHSARTSIEAIYPATDTLPENLLRMYICFSAPMSTGEAYHHVRLVDAGGTIVEKPFLIIDQELWDESRQRFTLLFDPGRIKRGIRANLEMGPPLQANNTYRLLVDHAWQDERGDELSSGYEKIIVVKNSERTKLTPEHWRIVEPLAGTNGPVVVTFDKPMDHFLALKYITVVDPLNEEVQGEAVVSSNDKIWEFRPHQSWVPGRYTLAISPHLEDAAGNNFNNPFDLDLSTESRVDSSKPILIDFEVGGAAR
jgi:hypothetical protein